MGRKQKWGEKEGWERGDNRHSVIPSAQVWGFASTLSLLIQT